MYALMACKENLNNFTLIVYCYVKSVKGPKNTLKLDTPPSVGLLWTNDQLAAETCT